MKKDLIKIQSKVNDLLSSLLTEIDSLGIDTDRVNIDVEVSVKKDSSHSNSTIKVSM